MSMFVRSAEEGRVWCETFFERLWLIDDKTELPMWERRKCHFISLSCTPTSPLHILPLAPPSTTTHRYSPSLSHNLIIHFTLSSSSSRGACGSVGGQPFQAVAPPSGPGVPMPQMHLHMLQRPDVAAAPAEARRGQTLPVPALLLWQQSTEPARGASTPRAQGQLGFTGRWLLPYLN